MKSPWTTWLELVRLPNLFTVPGDAWVGYAVATAMLDARWSIIHMTGMALTVLLAYAGGLIQNDLTDQKQDRRERPERPLPSGRITPIAARAALVLCWTLALGSAWITGGSTTLWICGILLATISLYNVVLKSRHPGWSCAAMGACRALSLLVGATVAGRAGPVAFVMAFWLATYIAAVTWIARDENRSQTFNRGDALPPCGALGGWTLTAFIMNLTLGDPVFIVPAMAVALAVLALCGYTVKALINHGQPVEPTTIQKGVGRMIRLLLPAQSMALLFVCQTMPQAVFALMLTALGLPLAQSSARRFSAS